MATIKDEPKASIILATYNWHEALGKVLAGLCTQSEKNFEVVIADDGSDDNTKKLIENYRARQQFSITHLWQEDRGFRKSKILNEAIAAAKAPALIFLDGDCVPHSDYVKYHLQLLEDEQSYVAGRRVDLSPEYSEFVKAEFIEMGCLNGSSLLFRIKLFFDCLRKEGSRPFHRSYIVRNKLIRKICGLEKVVDMKGCNFSVLKKHMLAINGFDESFEGYGREDTDVEIRLQNLGLKIKSAKNLCLQFHLWHKERAFTPNNDTLLADLKASGRIKAIVGLENRVDNQ